MSEGTMKIADNVVAALAYTLTNDEGEVMDEASGDDLLWYLHGHENLLPAVEGNLLGLGVGDHVKFSLEAHEGYGERDGPTCSRSTATCFRRRCPWSSVKSC